MMTLLVLLKIYDEMGTTRGVQKNRGTKKIKNTDRKLTEKTNRDEKSITKTRNLSGSVRFQFYHKNRWTGPATHKNKVRNE